MKKFLDRNLFAKVGAQLWGSVAVICAFALVVPLFRGAVTGIEYSGFFQSFGWGLKQVSSPGGAVGTLEGLDVIESPAARLSMLAVSICCWLVSIGVFSFITGSIVNWFRNRKNQIDAGLVRYRFRNHGIIVGWDFQGPECVRCLLHDCGEVLVVAGAPACGIRRDLERVLPRKMMSRVYIYNAQITVGLETICDAWPELSKTIVVLGEKSGISGDGENLHIEHILCTYLESRVEVRRKLRLPPIRFYIHIDDAVLYQQAREKESEFETGQCRDQVVREVFNFYESWAWHCLSRKDACDGAGRDWKDKVGKSYLPLRHRRDAERVELFILGASRMGRAFANYAMPLMNYGEDRKHCRITIFDKRENEGAFLPERSAIDEMPELDIEFRRLDGSSPEASDIMIAAASDPKTAVTIVIAIPEPAASMKMYMQLANTLRRMDVSVLVWQAVGTDQCPPKSFLTAPGGQAHLRFFGMTDCLPWMSPARQEGCMALNFFHDVKLPSVSDDHFLKVAEYVWEMGGKAAQKEWLACARRTRVRTVMTRANNFKELAFAFPDCLTNVESRLALLHAHHNGWWTERLLLGLRFGSTSMEGWRENRERLRSQGFNGCMVPFDELDDAKKESNRINIAAMKVCGFFESNLDGTEHLRQTPLAPLEPF